MSKRVERNENDGDAPVLNTGFFPFCSKCPYLTRKLVPRLNSCSRPNGVRTSAPSLYFHPLSHESSPDALNPGAPTTSVANVAVPLPVVGYRAP